MRLHDAPVAIQPAIHFGTIPAVRAVFDGADLRGAKFRGARLAQARFRNADMRSLSLKSGERMELDLFRAEVTDEQLAEAKRR